MSTNLHEQLSAAMDGELNPAEHALLTRHLAADATLRDTWERYHLIATALRRDLPARMPCALAKRVSAILAHETSYAAPSSSRPRTERRWLKPLASLAIAASVASVAILTFNSGNAPAPGPIAQTVTAQTVTAPAPAPATPVTGPATLASSSGAAAAITRPAPDGEWLRLAPEQRAQAHNDLLNYMISHNEYSAAASGVSSMLPHVRIVGRDSNGQ